VENPALWTGGDFDDVTDAHARGEATTVPQHFGGSSPTNAQWGLAPAATPRPQGATSPLPPVFDPGAPPRRRYGRKAAAGVGVGLGVAAVTAALIAVTSEDPDLVVTSVSASVAPTAGQCPEATFVLTADVVTNGGPGQIVTRWLQPDGQASDTQTQQLAEGQTRLTATLTYVQAGREPWAALARFEVLSPNTMQSPLVPVRYIC
jgi:hypothetical protein